MRSYGMNNRIIRRKTIASNNRKILDIFGCTESIDAPGAPPRRCGDPGSDRDYTPIL
jgi:hypothetical protein